MAAKERQSRIDLDTDIEIRRLALVHHASPAQIYRKLEESDKFKLPDIRTVQRIVRQMQPTDLSGEWVFAEAEPADAVLVLETMAAVVNYLGKGVAPFVPSQEQAEMIVKIRRVAPELDPWKAFTLALSYWSVRFRKESTTALDYLIAFAPWRSDDADKLYRFHVNRGAIPSDPFAFSFVNRQRPRMPDEIIAAHQEALDALGEGSEDANG